jgi:hypothetical protein
VLLEHNDAFSNGFEGEGGEAAAILIWS